MKTKTDSATTLHISGPSILRIALGCVLAPALLVLNSCREDIPGTSQEKGDTVDLRALPAMGLKWTERSSINGRFQDGSPGGGRDTSLIQAEVIAASADTITIKSITETTQSWWGDAYENPDSDSAKTRLTIRTLDRCGKVLSSEGASADDGTQSPFPDRPIQLGESFSTEYEGSGTAVGKKLTIRYTLSEVITVNNRRMAVLNFEYSGDCYGSGTEWRDLHTGLIVKSSAKVTMENLQGLRMSVETDSKITDVNGQKWLD